MAARPFDCSLFLYSFVATALDLDAHGVSRTNRFRPTLALVCDLSRHCCCYWSSLVVVPAVLSLGCCFVRFFVSAVLLLEFSARRATLPLGVLLSLSFDVRAEATKPPPIDPAPTTQANKRLRSFAVRLFLFMEVTL